jgi:hypothetical protein
MAVSKALTENSDASVATRILLNSSIYPLKNKSNLPPLPAICPTPKVKDKIGVS